MRRNLTAVMLVAGVVLAIGGGGTFAVDLSGRLTASGDIVVNGTGADTTLSGTTFSNITIDDNRALYNYDDTTFVGNAFTVSGSGSLRVGDSSSFGALEVGRFLVTGGVVNIEGNHGNSGNWANDNSFITGGWTATLSTDQTSANAAVSLTGGVVNLKNGGRIQTTWGDPYHTMFHIGGTAVINMEGVETVLKAADAFNRTDPSHASTQKGAVMLIDGGTINVKAGAAATILSRDTTISGGTINVDSSASLIVSGSAAEDNVGSPSAGVAHTSSSDTTAWGDFALGAATINNKGEMELTGDFEVTSGYDLNNSGTLKIGGDTTATGTALNLDGGNNIFVGTVDATSGINVGNGSNSTASASFGGDITGSVVVDDGSDMAIDGDVTVTGDVTMNDHSSLTINSGSALTVTDNLEVSESTTLVINSSGSGTGTLDVGTMTVNGSDNVGVITDYLLSQSSNSLAGGKEYAWDDDAKKIIYATIAAADPMTGVAGVLNRTGNGRLLSALNSEAIDTWAAIINGSMPATLGTQGAITKELMNTYLNNVTIFTPADEQRSVVSALAGLDAAKSIDVAMLTATNVAGRIQGRVMDNNLARAGAGERFGSVDAMASAMLNGIFSNRFWIGGFGLWEDADRRGFDSGYKYKSGGFIAGYDRIIGPLTVGGSFAYTAGDYEDKNSLASDSDIDNFAFNLYGTYNHASGFFATIIGGYTYSDYDLNNLLTRAGQWNQSKFHANTWTAGGSLGYDIRPTESLSITPTAGLYYYTSSTNAFQTTLSNGMEVERDSAELPIDLAVNYDIPVGYDGIVRLSAHTGYAYSFGKSGGKLNAFGYNGIDGSSISGIEGRESGRHTWNIGAGVNYSNERLDIGVQYDYYTRADHTAHRVLGTVGISF